MLLFVFHVSVHTCASAGPRRIITSNMQIQKCNRITWKITDKLINAGSKKPKSAASIEDLPNHRPPRYLYRCFCQLHASPAVWMHNHPNTCTHACCICISRSSTRPVCLSNPVICVFSPFSRFVVLVAKSIIRRRQVYIKKTQRQIVIIA